MWIDEHRVIATRIRDIKAFAITEQPNKGPKLKLTKDDWSQLITGETAKRVLSDCMLRSRHLTKRLTVIES